MKNYYEILHLSKDADDRQIRDAFRQLSKRYHPDRHQGSKAYEEKFKEINEAYQLLKDPIRRWEYKQAIQRRPAPPRPSRPQSPPRPPQERPVQARVYDKWDTPDFAGRFSRPPREKRHFRRPKPGSGKTEESAGTGFHTFAWACCLFLVLSVPFFMADDAASPSASPAAAQFSGYSAQETSADNILQRLDDRYRRDIRRLSELRRIDPSLEGLNLETGYYEGFGRSVRLSWDVLQLVREKRWKEI